MIIDGTTLELLEELIDGKGLCKCKSCGIVDVYNLKYARDTKQECKSCKELHKTFENKSDARKEVERLMQQEQDRVIKGVILAPGNKYIETRTSITGLPIGKELGDYILIGYIGLLGANGRKCRPTKVAIQCRVCNDIEIRDIKEVATMTGKWCSRISKLKREASERETAIRTEIKNRKINASEKAKIAQQKKIQAAEDKAIAKVAKEIAREQQKKANADLKEQQKRQKRQKIAEKESAKLTAYKEAIMEKNPDYFVKVRREGDGFLTTLICKNCGSAITFANTNKTKVHKCKNCEKKEKNPFYKGLYQRDYTNTVFNGLRIVKQYVTDDGYKCDLVCRMCGEQIIGEDLYDVMNRQIFCNCDKAGLFWVCPECWANHLITPNEMMSMTDEGFKCTCGKGIISKAEVANEMVISDAGDSMRDKAKAIGQMFKTGNSNTEIRSRSQLVKERNPLYAGTDGEYYYRCHCLEHNVSLILNNSEIDDYDHTQCYDSRQHLLSTPQADDIKL